MYMYDCAAVERICQQHKYQLGITFSFIIAVAPKCQQGHNLHPINIFTSIIRPLVSVKYEKWSEEMLFSYRFLFSLALSGKRSQEGKRNNPLSSERKGQKKNKTVIFSFICLRRGFAASSPSKTRIKGTGGKNKWCCYRGIILKPACDIWIVLVNCNQVF